MNLDFLSLWMFTLIYDWRFHELRKSKYKAKHRSLLIFTANTCLRDDNTVKIYNDYKLTIAWEYMLIQQSN